MADVPAVVPPSAPPDASAAAGAAPDADAVLDTVLAAAFRAAPSFLHVLRGPDFVFEFANEAYYQLVGRRDLIGRPAFEAMPEAAAGGFPARLREVLLTGRPFAGRELPVTLARTPGAPPEERLIDLEYLPLADAAGRVTRVLGYGTDVTERVHARRRAEAAESRVQAVVAQAPVAIVVTEGPEHRFALVNAQAEALTRRRDLVGRRYAEAYPELADSLGVQLDRAYATGEPFVARESRVAFARPAAADAAPDAPNGAPGAGHDEVYLDLVLQPLRAPGAAPGAAPGPVTGILHFAVDVTAQVRARAALAASEARFRLMADAVPQIVWVADADGRVEFFNRQWFAYTGAPDAPTTADAVGATYVHPDDQAATAAAFADARRRGTTFAVEHRIRSADGAYRWFLVRAEPFRDSDTGAALRWFGASVDIDDRKQAEAERERLLGAAEAAQATAEAERARAEQANQAKSQFLATMSHELRTPLNAIGGYAELLELGIRGPVTPEQRTDLARIQASQRHLLGLVNEVLDLAKVDAGGVTVAHTESPADAAVDAALALVRPQAAAKGLALTEQCTTAAGVRYVGDEPRVRQILVNLLANAVKFTPAGGRVTLTCTVTEAPPVPGAVGAGATAGPFVGLRVEDTGVGIAPDQRERVFEPFTQAGAGAGPSGNPYTRAVGGTGLGLTISRRLARLMGGDLTLESRLGAGSAFTLWLPAAERRARPRGPTPARGVPAVASDDAPRDSTARVREAPGGVGGDGSARAEHLVLAAAGAALVDEAGRHVRALRERLRAAPDVPRLAPTGRPFTDAELDDHAAALIVDIGLGLRTIAEPHAEPGLLRDGTAILGVIAERHGGQRARLGWSAAALAREFALVGELLAAAVDRAAEQAGADQARGPGTTAGRDRAQAVVAELLAYAERASQGGLRLASAPAEAPADAPAG